ncbi:N-acetylglutamate synthase-like GNAT family acetyltransferase [Kribbella amoyensis]|uniref:N-acetylglutamate synthase-like GNAT family acetyltransferase n=1 Tax=Kribbella amoyensis TaxID=996641 RepID=A0A561BUD0_9ACTN|nr:GNAT family N-acetyltransferase [Kribbella amoyensis]TWD82448.1 N-acetylglutamate synthase-like GNAT family acetyltransferase [Kribbella amoyensis]
MRSVEIRAGGAADVAGVLELLDGATEWLVAQGRTDQWGTERHSANPRRVEQVTGFAADGGLWIAERDGRAVGALAVGAALPYVPPATEPELYVRLLVTDRAAKGTGIGTALLDHARSLAKELGVGMLRVDCFAGGDGALVRYYEGQGFTRAEAFEVPVNDSAWPGQLLIQRL